MIHYSCVHLGFPEEPQNTSSLSAHLNTLCCGNLFTVSFRKRKDCVVCISLGVYSKDVISCVASSYELNMVIRVPCIICTLVILYLYCLLSNVCVPNTTVEPFDVKGKASSLWSFVASSKRISSISDFIHLFS